MYNYASALGLGAGVAKDEAAALAWFQKAAALGHAKSINFVGGFFEAGVVVERDMAHAADCYRRAAEGGDFRGQFNHARRLFEAGRPEEARPWLERARGAASPEFLATMERWLAASPFGGRPSP
jgi:TPR repeat protein